MYSVFDLIFILFSHENYYSFILKQSTKRISYIISPFGSYDPRPPFWKSIDSNSKEFFVLLSVVKGRELNQTSNILLTVVSKPIFKKKTKRSQNNCKIRRNALNYDEHWVACQAVIYILSILWLQTENGMCIGFELSVQERRQHRNND